MASYPKKIDPPRKVFGKLDRLAQNEDELMFLKREEILLIEEISEGVFMGVCEGIKGIVYQTDVISNINHNKNKKFKVKRKSQVGAGVVSPVPGPTQQQIQQLEQQQQQQLIQQQIQRQLDGDERGDVPKLRVPKKGDNFDTSSHRSSVSSISSDSRQSISTRTKLTDDDIDEYGFEKGSISYNASLVKPEVHREREKKWIKMMTPDFHVFRAKNSEKVRERCAKGIPASLRGKAWFLLCCADKVKETYKKTVNFNELKEKKSETPLEILEVIERDLDRCYPTHVRFREPGKDAQVDLEHILKAYAFYNPQLGYCQGMGFLAGMWLLEMTEEQSFWMMVTLLENEKYLKGCYTTDLGQIKVLSKALSMVSQSHFPQLHSTLEELNIDYLMFGTTWFIPVYTTILPWTSVLRIWDMFLCEGKVLIIRVALAILSLLKEKILKSQDMNVVMTMLLHLPQEDFTPDKLLPAIEKVKITNSKIEMAIKLSN